MDSSIAGSIRQSLKEVYNPIEAKRIFLEELSWDSLEMEQLYKDEFPDADGGEPAEPLF